MDSSEDARRAGARDRLGADPAAPGDYGEFRALFGVPDHIGFHFAIPLGYPRGRFGPTNRKPTAETTHWNQWGGTVPWA